MKNPNPVTLQEIAAAASMARDVVNTGDGSGVTKHGVLTLSRVLVVLYDVCGDTGDD